MTHLTFLVARQYVLPWHCKLHTPSLITCCQQCDEGAVHQAGLQYLRDLHSSLIVPCWKHYAVQTFAKVSFVPICKIAHQHESNRFCNFNRPGDRKAAYLRHVSLLRHAAPNFSRAHESASKPLYLANTFETLDYDDRDEVSNGQRHIALQCHNIGNAHK